MAFYAQLLQDDDKGNDWRTLLKFKMEYYYTDPLAIEIFQSSVIIGFLGLCVEFRSKLSAIGVHYTQSSLPE